MIFTFLTAEYQICQFPPIENIKCQFEILMYSIIVTILVLEVLVHYHSL